MAFNQDKVQSVDFFKRIGACAVKATDKRAKKKAEKTYTFRGQATPILDSIFFLSTALPQTY